MTLSALALLAFLFGVLGFRSLSPASSSPSKLAVTAPVVSPRRVPELLAAAASDAQTRAGLTRAGNELGITPGSGQSCILIRQGGRRIWDRRSDFALVPASSAKLFTAVAAMETLGPDKTFTTEVRIGQDTIEDGVVTGSMYLVGGGDPVLFTSDYLATMPARLAIFTPLVALADSVVRSGVRRIEGGVIGDDRRFDNERAVPSWDPAYALQGQVGPIDALLVNQGFGRFAGGRVAAPDPAVHAGAVLTDLLRQRGVTVGQAPSAGSAPENFKSVASIESPRVSALITEMLTESNNTTAEVLLKQIAFERRSLGPNKNAPGARMAGTVAMRDTLIEDGLALDGTVFVDGSGLDRGNRASCRSLDGVLNRSGPDGALANALARAGETGTLRGRLANTPAVGRIRAKTGSLANVSSFTGWAQPANGSPPLSFATISNGVDSEAARRFEDRLALLMSTLPAPQAPAAYALPGAN